MTQILTIDVDIGINYVVPNPVGLTKIVIEVLTWGL